MCLYFVCLYFAYIRALMNKYDKVGEVTLGQTKTPLFLTGLDVSLAESTRFELVHDC